MLHDAMNANRSGRGRCPRACGFSASVSLLNDVATESIYPLLPFFLTSVLGAGASRSGLIEGAAEAVSSVLEGRVRPAVRSVASP